MGRIHQILNSLNPAEDYPIFSYQVPILLVWLDITPHDLIGQFRAVE